MIRFLIWFFLSLPIFVVAQSNFQKGYVVTLTGDTLEGFIDYRERKSNPEGIKFRLTETEPQQFFDIFNCKAFGLYGLEAYQRHAVKISKSEENISKLSDKADTLSVRDTLFLKVLQIGKSVTLFDYSDDIKKRFFISESNGRPYELIRRFYLDGETRNLRIADVYLNQLSLIAHKFGFTDRFGKQQLANIKYRTADLLKFTSALNDLEPPKNKEIKLRLIAGGGISKSRVAYTGSHLLAKPEAKTKTSLNPFFNLGVDIFNNPAIGKLIGRAEFGVFKSKNEMSSAQRLHSFDLLTISMAPQLIYNLYNTSRIKVFIAGGLVVNYSIIDNDVQKRHNSFTDETVSLEEPVVFEKVSFSFLAKTGVILSRRIEIYGGYFSPNTVSHYSAFNINSKKITTGINYLFGKH